MQKYASKNVCQPLYLAPEPLEVSAERNTLLEMSWLWFFCLLVLPYLTEGLLKGLSEDTPGRDCDDILQSSGFELTSGYYWIGVVGNARKTYCLMANCVGWTRILKLREDDSLLGGNLDVSTWNFSDTEAPGLESKAGGIGLLWGSLESQPHILLRLSCTDTNYNTRTTLLLGFPNGLLGPSDSSRTRIFSPGKKPKKLPVYCAEAETPTDYYTERCAKWSSTSVIWKVNNWWGLNREVSPQVSYCGSSTGMFDGDIYYWIPSELDRQSSLVTLRQECASDMHPALVYDYYYTSGALPETLATLAGATSSYTVNSTYTETSKRSSPAVDVGIGFAIIICICCVCCCRLCIMRRRNKNRVRRTVIRNEATTVPSVMYPPPVSFGYNMPLPMPYDYGYPPPPIPMAMLSPPVMSSQYCDLNVFLTVPPGSLFSLVVVKLEGAFELAKTIPTSVSAAMGEIDELCSKAVRAIGNGMEVKVHGEARLAAFRGIESVIAAVQYAINLQRELLTLNWSQDILASELAKEVRDGEGKIIFKGLRARMAVSTGEPLIVNESGGKLGIDGPLLDRTCAMALVAHPGQILMGEEVKHEVVNSPKMLKQDVRVTEVGVYDLGRYRERLFQVFPLELVGRSFPPPDLEMLKRTAL